MKNKLLDTYHIEGLYDISLSMESGLIYLHTSKRNCNKNSAFPFLVFPTIFCLASEGKACCEVTLGLHSITDGRIKPCCLGAWYMAAQTELNVSFLSLYLIREDCGSSYPAEETRKLRRRVTLYELTPDLVWRHQGLTVIQLGGKKNCSTRQITHCSTLGIL